MKLYAKIAALCNHIRMMSEKENFDNCEASKDRLKEVLNKYMPSGSGFDSGTKLDPMECAPDRLVFKADFHHMDDNGFYCGWSEHNVVVRPDFVHGFTLHVTGRDRRNIKEYISEVFYDILNREVLP